MSRDAGRVPQDRAPLTDRCIARAVGHIATRTTLVPRIAVVAGSGLSQLAERLEDPVSLPYEEIPQWPDSTVTGHAGALHVGSLAGVPAVIAAGRAHLYEGYSPQEVGFGVGVMAALGADTLVVTNAAGSLTDRLSPGDLMIIRDHVFLPGLAGLNPLRGPESPGRARFPTMVGAYSRPLAELADEEAQAVGMELKGGIYVMVAGPSYETPAEARWLAGLGDAVGMSTAPEVVVARQRDMRVLGLSVITNRVVMDPQEVPAGTDLHAEVVDVSGQVTGRLADLIEAVARRV